MDSQFFCRILDAALVPFIQSMYPGGHRLQQDNDPKHTSTYTQDWLIHHHIDWWATPPESLDLNPIERVWNSLKVYLSRHVRPTNKAQLIKEFWKCKMTPRQCRRYINHIHKVLPKVIAADGHATVDDVK